jgi:hypothetical protein
MTPGLVDEIVMIDLLALFLSIATVEIVWYAAKKACPTEVGDLQFFLTFILVIVPFVMTIFFGLVLINYNAMAIQSGWPQALPLTSALSPPIIGAVVFYVGQTLWLWWGWRWHGHDWLPDDSVRNRAHGAGRATVARRGVHIRVRHVDCHDGRHDGAFGSADGSHLCPDRPTN